MKRALRNITALALCAPIIVMTCLRAVFQGKKTAIRYYGPTLTSAAKRSLRYWVPDISDASEFNSFKDRMKGNMRSWRPLYDVEIAEDTPDTIKLRIGNCPFCEVFTMTSLSGLNAYVCKADWEVAEDNRDKWTFERQHAIGAGDTYCDHIYKRAKSLHA